MQDTTQDAAFYPTMTYGMPKRHVRDTATSTVCLTRSSIAVRRGRPQSLLVPIQNQPPHVTDVRRRVRSEEHTPELQSLMRISYAVIYLKKHNHPDTEHAAHQ